MFKFNPLAHIFVTSDYGPRIHPVTKASNFHNGVDLRAATDTPLLAVDDGIVRISKANNGGPSTGLGYYIVIEHKTYCVAYAHLKTFGLPAGSVVKAGDIVGYSGNTGVSSGPHLHFEVRRGAYTATFWTKGKDGQYLNSVDPKEFFVDRTTPEHEQIIRQKLNNPQAWIDFIEEMKDHPVGKWLPDLIKKIGG